MVLGANGPGKTTQLQLLAGYLWSGQGRVTMLGEAFGQTDLRELKSVARERLLDTLEQFATSGGPTMILVTHHLQKS